VPPQCAKAADLLNRAGWRTGADEHAAWITERGAARHLYPLADVPVFQLSMPTQLPRLRLRPGSPPAAREGILIVRLRQPDAQPVRVRSCMMMRGRYTKQFAHGLAKR